METNPQTTMSLACCTDLVCIRYLHIYPHYDGGLHSISTSWRGVEEQGEEEDEGEDEERGREM